MGAPVKMAVWLLSAVLSSHLALADNASIIKLKVGEGCAALFDSLAAESALKDSLDRGFVRDEASIGIVAVERDPLGEIYLVERRRIGAVTFPWMSTHTTMGYDPQASPMFILMLLGGDHNSPGRLASILGYNRRQSHDQVILPSQPRLNAGIEYLNRYLPDELRVRIRFYEQKRADIDLYLRRFASQAELPVASPHLQNERQIEPRTGKVGQFLHAPTAANHYMHDVNLHAGAILLPPRLLENVQRQVSAHLVFLDWLAKQDAGSLLSEDGRRLVTAASQRSGKSEIELEQSLLRALVYENKLSLAQSVDVLTGNMPVGFHNEVSVRRRLTQIGIERQFHQMVAMIASLEKPLIQTTSAVTSAQPSKVMKQTFDTDRHAFHFFDLRRIETLMPRFDHQFPEVRAYLGSLGRSEEHLVKICVEILEYRQRLRDIAETVVFP